MLTYTVLRWFHCPTRLCCKQRQTAITVAIIVLFFLTIVNIYCSFISLLIQSGDISSAATNRVVMSSYCSFEADQSGPQTKMSSPIRSTVTFPTPIITPDTPNRSNSSCQI